MLRACSCGSTSAACFHLAALGLTHSSINTLSHSLFAVGCVVIGSDCQKPDQGACSICCCPARLRNPEIIDCINSRRWLDAADFLPLQPGVTTAATEVSGGGGVTGGNNVELDQGANELSEVYSHLLMQMKQVCVCVCVCVFVCVCTHTHTHVYM